MKKVALTGLITLIACLSLGIMTIPCFGATTTLNDDFNGNSLDTTKWSSSSIFSGTTDPTIGVFDGSQALQIGPLYTNISGSHYNGVVSVNRYDLTGAFAAVQL